MRIRRGVFTSVAAAMLVAAGLAGSQTASAQVASHPLNEGVSSSSAPVGPGESRLPLLNPSQRSMEGRTPATAPPLGTPYVSPSSEGAAVEGGAPSPSAYGTFSWPYTTARVANTTTQKGTSIERSPVTAFPYRAAGKLWMRFGGSWFVCTASMIKRGLLVTAAHCVHNYGLGTAGFADEVVFFPANVSDSFGVPQPYGKYTARRVFIPAPYKNGTDTCEVTGIVCNNDIAVVVLRERNGVPAGDVVGWYGYGANGYSFVASAEFGGGTIADITQLGYPVAWDSGLQMQRGNSFGKLYSTPIGAKTLLNTELGSAMTGGSSGGPWLVNFGTNPTITGTATAGTAADRLVVIGTTSWGYTSTGPKVQGASWFGQNAQFPLADYGGRGPGNIGALVNAACTAFPTAC